MKANLFTKVLLSFVCVFKSFPLKYAIAHNSKKYIIYSKLILQILSMNIFHKKLLNICLVNCSRNVSNFAMPSRLLGAPTVFSWGCSVNQVFLKILQNSQEISCLIKESLVQVFFCEIWEIFNNTFFIEHLLWLFLELSFASRYYNLPYILFIMETWLS